MALTEEIGFVYWGGLSDKRTAVGLGGSLKHLLGNMSPNTIYIRGQSLLYEVGRGIKALLQQDSQYSGKFHDGNLMYMASILSEKGLVQPKEQVEFLAKRLLYRER